MAGRAQFTLKSACAMQGRRGNGPDFGACCFVRRYGWALPNRMITVDADSVRSRRDFEAFLRSAGFPRAAAKALAYGGWRALSHDPQDTVLDEARDLLRASIEHLKGPQ